MYNGLNVRKEATINSDILGRVQYADKIKLIQKQTQTDQDSNKWVNIETSGGITGWIYERFVLPDEPFVTTFDDFDAFSRYIKVELVQMKCVAQSSLYLVYETREDTIN